MTQRKGCETPAQACLVFPSSNQAVSPLRCSRLYVKGCALTLSSAQRSEAVHQALLRSESFHPLALLSSKTFEK